MVKKVKSAVKAKKPAAKKSVPAKSAKKKAQVSKPGKTSKSAKTLKKAKPAQKPAEPKKLTPLSRVKRHQEVAWRIIDGEAVIVTPADSVMHTLNDVGTRIWEMLTGERNIKDIAQLLCADFDVDLNRAQADTIWFVSCLQKKGLIQAAG